MAAVDTRPVNVNQGPSTDADQQIAGFTAVNGRSPPSWQDNLTCPRGFTNHTGELVNQVDDHTTSMSANERSHTSSAASQHYRDDSGTLAKRKRAMSNEGDSAGGKTSKRRKGSGQQNDADSGLTNGQTSVYGQNHRPQHVHSTSHQWDPRSSDDDHGSEARLVQALGKEAEHTPNHVGAMSDSPTEGYQLGGMPPHSQQGSIQLTPGTTTSSQSMTNKQRKRTFANRTKTGCLTCRMRKKKCDEGKPTCQNCARGSFECKGYAQIGSATKQPVNRDHHPIQAKHGAFEQVPTQPYPPPQPSYLPTPPFYPIPEMNGHPHQQPPPSRPVPTPEDQHRSMNDPNMRMAYSRDSWSDGFSQAYSDGLRHSQVIPIPYSDPNRDAKRLPPVQPAAAPMQAPSNMQPPPPPAQSVPTRNHSYSEQTRSSPYNDSRMGLAQAALQHPSGYGASALEKTEKEKMMSKLPFNPSDPALKHERHTCKIACYEFNKGAADPTMLKDHERRERFRAILECRQDSSKSQEHRDQNKGHVGQNVDVEAPFYCDYGYNVYIDNNTDIGKNCTFMDANSIRIGKNCTIGPDVSFYSQDGEHHPKTMRPFGQKRPAIAKPIVVEDDVFIGGRSTILPGVTIGRGAVIGAGTTVVKNVPPGNITVNPLSGADNRYPKAVWGNT